MDTVKKSKLKAHSMFIEPKSSHLHKDMLTDMLLKATSKNTNTANTVVVITETLVISCAPLTPTFLPKNPETIEPNKGNIITARYIIYIL